MSMVETLNNQHSELLQLSEDVLSLVYPNGLTADPATIRLSLLLLFGRLTVHLTTEDEHVYPILTRHPDRPVRDVARRFELELGGLARALDTYKTTWMNEDAIREKTDEFIHHTRLLLAALAQRIAKEDSELYVLLEGS